ncbi:MAG: hypothetical protein IPK58_09955 [Acidobacteria bacterium]|nr:hypothetical protein [Acidobacteriota bacterium]
MGVDIEIVSVVDGEEISASLPDASSGTIETPPNMLRFKVNGKGRFVLFVWGQ